MVECNACTMVYLEKAPDVAELFTNLAWEKTIVVEHVRRDKELGWLRKLSRSTRGRNHILPRKKITDIIEKIAKPGNILDVGCADGGHLLGLSERFNPCGIEVSKGLAETGRAALEARGGEMINLDALGGLRKFPDNHFSAVIMRSFLEHDVNPLPILKECQRTLVKGGIVVIKVPNYGSLNSKLRGRKWCGLRFPDHVNYFTPKTLSRMVTDASLSIKRFNLIDQLPTSDNMWLFAYKP